MLLQGLSAIKVAKDQFAEPTIKRTPRDAIYYEFNAQVIPLVSNTEVLAKVILIFKLSQNINNLIPQNANKLVNML